MAEVAIETFWSHIEKIHKRLDEIDTILESFRKAGIDVDQIEKDLREKAKQKK